MNEEPAAKRRRVEKEYNEEVEDSDREEDFTDQNDGLLKVSFKFYNLSSTAKHEIRLYCLWPIKRED